MRRITGYIDGRPIWSENVASYARLSTIGGSIPVSAPGPNDAAVHAKQKAATRKRPETPEQRHAAYLRTKRYRESKRRAA